jgi:uncharacterized Fe-S cluster-containing radical SAM superfamily enzyme
VMISFGTVSRGGNLLLMSISVFCSLNCVFTYSSVEQILCAFVAVKDSQRIAVIK